MADGLSDVDWDAPWFAPWRVKAERVATRWQSGVLLSEALNQEQGRSPIFVAQSELAAGDSYEDHIFRTGTCPTRENLHDFFNGLCWLHMPLAKSRLNAVQAAQIGRAGIGGPRGPVRDAITLFDESGALLHAPPPLWDALLKRDWRRAFIDLRPLWEHAHLTVFGHAVLEKLVRPRKDVTAHVWCSNCPAGAMDEVDTWLATQVTEEKLSGKPFTPLPLLGIPGWTGANQNFSFYDDSLVFRPAGRPKTNTTGRPETSRS